MSLRLNGSNSGFSEITAPATAGDNTLTLPAGNGSANQFLKNSGTAGTLEFSSSATDGSGRLLINTSSTIPSPGIFNPALQVVHVSANADTCGISLSKFQAGNPSASPFIFQKSRHDTIGSHTIVANGDVLGVVQFTGSDGSTFVPAAAIEGEVDGTPGGTDMPGRLVFSTTADGASTPTDRMRINSSGTIGTSATNADGMQISTSTAAGTSHEIIRGMHSGSAIFDGTLCFRVFNNGNTQNINNSYGAISDIKLKENIVDASSQWDDIKRIQVRKYNFKESTGQQTHTQLGLVAQEVELVSPGLVSESPDRETIEIPVLDVDGNSVLDEEGNPKVEYKEQDSGTVTKSVNYSVLYMKAVKALQEAQTRIEALETQHADLLARVTALEAA